MLGIAVVIAANVHKQPAFHQVQQLLADVIAIIKSVFKCTHFIDKMLVHPSMGSQQRIAALTQHFFFVSKVINGILDQLIQCFTHFFAAAAVMGFI